MNMGTTIYTQRIKSDVFYSDEKKMTADHYSILIISENAK